MQFINFSHDTASIVQVKIPVNCAARLKTDAMCCDLKPFAHFEREHAHVAIHSRRLWPVSQKLSKLL